MSASPASIAPAVAPPVPRSLLPLALLVFFAFLPLGIPLSVLPLLLHDKLGAGTTLVGIVIGLEFVAAVLSRPLGGRIADGRGPRDAVLAGVALIVLAGAGYFAALALLGRPALAIGALLLGRVALGAGESLITTGALAWGVGMLGVRSAGRVMVWVGIAIYAAFGAGPALGIALERRAGFGGVALLATLLPLATLPFVALLPRTPGTGGRRVPFAQVLGRVLLPGAGLALCGIGFGAITAFVSLLFAERGWADAAWCFTAFGAGFIGARLLFSGAPDRFGGARVAMPCLVIELAGQLLIWGGGAPWMAWLGAALTGFGYSLAFPAFGVEAVRRAPPEVRGGAMGAYVAFLDVSLGVCGPLNGWVAAHAGLPAVYLVGAAGAALAFGVALALLRAPRAAG
ncbi:MFS transporter [Derxia gummosa]|uniref:MFS transporter n=1 Tax=Derxia gummosa DSM 723 TaxID=1121388 RepID=A0A8B6X359_9BURK|nr:MFS transporter [Derxia gummosa]